eukprot:1160386-Pelagomonas_calceolata.AAC.2
MGLVVTPGVMGLVVTAGVVAGSKGRQGGLVTTAGVVVGSEGRQGGLVMTAGVVVGSEGRQGGLVTTAGVVTGSKRRQRTHCSINTSLPASAGQARARPQLFGLLAREEAWCVLRPGITCCSHQPQCPGVHDSTPGCGNQAGQQDNMKAHVYMTKHSAAAINYIAQIHVTAHEAAAIKQDKIQWSRCIHHDDKTLGCSHQATIERNGAGAHDKT